MDAWMAVQHLRFGPSLLFLRVDRVEFWPDKRGTVGRHLAQLLSDHDPQPLAPRVFAHGSVAVQGFPALERLLYESDDVVWMTSFGCAVPCAIGGHLERIGAGLLEDWPAGGEPFGIRRAGGG